MIPTEFVEKALPPTFGLSVSIQGASDLCIKRLKNLTKTTMPSDEGKVKTHQSVVFNGAASRYRRVRRGAHAGGLIGPRLASPRFGTCIADGFDSRESREPPRAFRLVPPIPLLAETIRHRKSATDRSSRFRFGRDQPNQPKARSRRLLAISWRTPIRVPAMHEWH